MINPQQPPTPVLIPQDLRADNTTESAIVNMTVLTSLVKSLDSVDFFELRDSINEGIAYTNNKKQLVEFLSNKYQFYKTLELIRNFEDHKQEGFEAEVSANEYPMAG